MKVSDNNFQNMISLQNNLLGEYHPDDFLEEDILDDYFDEYRQIRLKTSVIKITADSIAKSFEKTKHDIEMDKLRKLEQEKLDQLRVQLAQLQESSRAKEKILLDKEIAMVAQEFNKITAELRPEAQ